MLIQAHNAVSQGPRVNQIHVIELINLKEVDWCLNCNYFISVPSLQL